MHIESCTFYMLTFTHRWRSIIRPGVYGSCVLRHGEPSGKPSLSFWNTPSLEECSTHLDRMAALTRIGKTWSGNLTGCWTEQVGVSVPRPCHSAPSHHSMMVWGTWKESPVTSLSKIPLVAQQELTGQIGATLILSKSHFLMVRRQLMEPTRQHKSMKISSLGRWIPKWCHDWK